MRNVLSAAAVLVLMVACGSPPTAAEPVVLRVVMADDWATAPALGAVIDAFEADHPGLRVELQGSPFSRVPELVQAARDLDQPYDLAHWHAFAAANAGLAQPVDGLWDDAGLTDAEYLDGAIEGVMWDGQHYGVPLDVNALVLLVNRTVTDAAGVDTDRLRTIAGFRAAADELVDSGVVDHAIPVTASSWSTYGWIVAHGGELVELDPESGQPTFRFDDPGTVAAVGLLRDLVDNDLAPPPFAPDLALDAVQSFAQGRVAMYATGSWDLPVTRRAVNGAAEFDGNIAILPLPQRDPSRPRTVLGGSSLFIPVDAEQPELAFELALRLTEDDTALRLAAEEGRLPARARVYEAELFRSSPQVAAFVDQLPHAEVMPLIAWPELADAFREALEAVLSGRAAAEPALSGLQRFAEESLG